MQQYRIADLVVAYDAHYPMLRDRSEKYVTKESIPTPLLSASEKRIADLRPTTPLLNDAEREYMLIGGDFYRMLVNHNGMLLHASAVVVNGEAYLFSAPSGTGKSTHTELWLRYFGEDAYILNDDKPAIRILDDGVYAYGTPFSGKYDISVNVHVPIRGIAFLARAEENSIERMSERQAIYQLLNQTVRPADVALYTKLLSVIDTLLHKVPVYQLRCNMELQAAETAYQTMSKGTVE